MRSLKSFFVLLLMVATVAMCAQPAFEVLPVSGDTTFQIQTTITNSDNSQSVTLTEPYGTVQVRDFIDIQITRNSRQISKAVKVLKDLDSESIKLKLLYNEWNERSYKEDTQEKYIADFVGTWQIKNKGTGILITIEDSSKVNQIGGGYGGELVIESKDIIILKGYSEKGDVVFYGESNVIFVADVSGEKHVLLKISKDIKKEDKRRK